MKKYIHILTALAILASCTKSEVNYEPSGQVTLAPVKGTLTKAAGNSGELKDLENPPKLHIWARWDEDDVYWYIFDAMFAYNDSYKAWAGEQGSYPWPLSGELSFAGYTHPTTFSCIVGYDHVANEFTFTEYINDEFDLCWFGRTKGYNNKVSGDAVEVTLNHALTWISIKAYGEGTPVDKWKINSLTLENVITRGNAICTVSTGKATWEAHPIYDKTDKDKVIDDGIDNYILNNNLAHTIQAPTVDGETKTGALLTDNIIIPQLPVNLIINYSYQVGTEIRTDSKKVSLGLGKKNGVDILWESGKHYTYTLIFKSNDIQVAPSFGTWGTENQNVTVE
jgi:hypothetical protein